MNNIKWIFTGILLFSMINVFAEKGSVSGIVVDGSTNDKIPFASVALFNNTNENPVVGTITDDAGNFTIKNVNLGSYKLVVSFIGYNANTIENVDLTHRLTKVVLGNIVLIPANVNIKEVEVTAMQNTVSTKIDRKVYSASDFETAQGGTAVDVLNKLPSISVDPDGTVSVRGTSDFMVYLNGKPTQMEASVLLGQISANSIENIDVITVPTARYDAQGKGGIINISTKKSGQEGLSVSANGLLGGAPWGEVTDKYSNYALNDNRFGGGLNLIYLNNELAMFGGFNYNKRNVNGSRVGDARLLQSDGSYYHMVAGGERPEWYENYSANIGMDYNLTENSTFSASYFYGNRTDGRSAFYVYNNFFGDINKNIIDGIEPDNHWVYNPNTDERSGIFHSGNIDFSQKFEDKSELKLSFLYEHSELNRALDNRDFDFNKPDDQVALLQRHFKESDNTPLDGFRLSVDFQKKLDNGNELGMGFQPQFVKQAGGFNYDTLNVASGAWGTNAQFNNYVDMSRAVYAGYIDYSGKAGNLNYIAGLRLEYTDQAMEIENPDYLNIFGRPTKPLYEVNQLDWFPTVHLKYVLNEKDALIFAASRRINRPPTKNMAPFLYRRHYEVYEVGDPELKPEYLTNFELSLDKKLGKQSIILTGFYRGTDNAVFRVNTVYDVEKVLIRSYTNSGNVKAMGAELNANLIAGKFAKFFVGGSLYNFNVQGDVFGFKEDNHSTNWSLKGNANFLLTKELKFTVDLDMRSATVTTQGRNESSFISNVALNYIPKKLKGWDFSAKVLNLFNTNQDALNTRAFDTSGTQIFYQEVEYDRFGPIVEFSVSYSLNMNGKSGKKVDSTFGKEQF